jgi:hypothetical protein
MTDKNSIGKILQNARNADVDNSADLPVKKRPKGRPYQGKRSNPDYTALTTMIPIKLHQMVKIALISSPDANDLSELTEMLLQQWLEKQEIYSYLTSKQKSD